jgi:hypothetical protein
MPAKDDLVKQILGQGLTSKWTGQGFGSAEANAADMARILADIGITDIKQFGKIPVYAPAVVHERNYNGKKVYSTNDRQGFGIAHPPGISGDYTIENDGVDEEGYGKFKYTPVPKDAEIKTIYGVEHGDSYSTVDPSRLKTVDGKLLADTGKTTFGNKETYQGVPFTYGDRQQGDFFGGTYAGKGNTGYGVQFQPDGTPVFFTQGASSNDLVKMFQQDPLFGTIAQIGAAYLGGPLGTAALNAAMGKSPQDILKAAALSYAGNAAGSAVSGTEGITDILGQTGTNIASNVAKQFVGSGGQNVDPIKALLGSGLVNELIGSSGDGPNSADFEEGFFQPGGEGYISSFGGDESVFDPTYGGQFGEVAGESVFDPTYGGQFGEVDGENVFDPTFGGVLPMPTEAPTGPGYYDEITGEFIPGEGPLQGPLGPETGNIDPNKEWEYSLTKPGVWTSKDGEEIDLSYMPDRDTAMSGRELMERAGAMPGGTKAPTKPATPGAKPGTTGNLGKVIAGAGTAATAVNPAADAITNLANQQQQWQAQQNNLASMLLGSQDKGADIKSFKEILGEDLFGGKYVPPSAGGAQSDESADYGRDNDSGTASQNEGGEQFFGGGHVDDFDVDALLQILRG